MAKRAIGILVLTLFCVSIIGSVAFAGAIVPRPVPQQPGEEQVAPPPPPPPPPAKEAKKEEKKGCCLWPF